MASQPKYTVTARESERETESKREEKIEERANA